MTYKGGAGKLDRLENHIRKRHKEESAELLQQVVQLYKKPDPVKGNQCEICGKVLAGDAAHLKRHKKMVHWVGHFKRRREQDDQHEDF